MTPSEKGLIEERIVIALSLATLPGLVLQILVELPATITSALDAFDFAVVAVFAVDYAVRLRNAHPKSGFILSAWSLLDLVIILLVIAAFFFSLPLLYSAPLLRTLRVAKLVTESGHSTEKPISQV